MSFRTKNVIWIVFWFVFPLVDERIIAPWYKFFTPPIPEGYKYQVLGFLPFILMGLYNAVYLAGRPLKKTIVRGYNINLFAFLYYTYLCLYMLYKGVYLPAIFGSFLLIFIINCVKYTKSFKV